MDPRQIACHVAQQLARIVHREDRPRIGRAGQCAHHEAAADPVARLQADQHLGRGHARGMRRTDNRRFAVMAKGPAFHESEARRAAEERDPERLFLRACCGRKLGCEPGGARELLEWAAAAAHRGAARRLRALARK